jgi:maleylpyruvate isomerase
VIDSRTLDETVAGCAGAHQRLLAHLDEALERGELTDDTVVDASLLPGWTKGHVLAHLARNAESYTRVFHEAMAGRATERYPGGTRQRIDEIRQGGGRSARELVADVRRTIWALESVWAAVPESGWELVGTSLGKPEPVIDLPFKRWREVEVHHADLGLAGFSFGDWSAEYVRRELRLATMAFRSRLPMGASALPAAAMALSPADRTAWLMGRLTVHGLAPVEQWW